MGNQLNSRARNSVPTLVVGLAAAVLATACASPADSQRDAATEPEQRLELVEVDAPAGDGAQSANLATGADGGVYLSWLEPSGEAGHALRFSKLGTSGPASWSQPRTIVEAESFFANWADFPSLVALDGGGLVAHWPQKSGDGIYAYDVMLARSEDGGETWGEAKPPHDDGTQTEHGFVTLLAEPGGGFTAAWLDGRNTGPPSAGGHGAGDGGHGDGGDGASTAMTIRGASFDAAGNQIAQAELDARICDCCQTSGVAVAGRVVVAYRDRSEEEVRDIYSVTRGEDGQWTEPVLVGPDNWQIAGCPVNGPAVSARHDTNAVAVAWFGLRDGTPEVKLAISNDFGATYSDPVLIERGSDGSATLGRVDVEWLDRAGWVVTWMTDVGSGEGEIRYRIVDGSQTSAKMGPTGVLATTGSSRSSGFPRLTRDGDGLVMVWRQTQNEERLHTARLRLSATPAATN